METYKVYIGISSKKVIENGSDKYVIHGGYGVVVTSEEHTKLELSKGFIKTNDLRMNMYALLDILTSIVTPARIFIYIPNGVIEDSITKKRIDKWVQGNTIKLKANGDLWLKLYPLLRNSVHEITFHSYFLIKDTWQAKRAKALSHSASLKTDKQIDLKPPPDNQQLSLFD